MNKNKLLVCSTAIVAIACVLMSGCKKKEVQEGPVEETLTAITLNDLSAGNFYVKSGDSFYLLPYEDQNFDISKEVKSTEDSENGMIKQDDNRLLDFVYKDSAIPTLYKNDQLIYVSTDPVNSFSWERFKDCGYSIGISGLIMTNSGKAKSGDGTRLANGSSLQAALSGVQMPEGSDLTVDKINGTGISKQYVNEAGIITGMSKDATAQIDFYVGTAPLQLTALADTRYFSSFELYQTDRYTLSTDGYAVIEVPSYFKSGYYLLNGTGLVKFLNVDRGVDESGISLETPYYYKGSDGKTMTFYEWQEANGIVSNDGVAATEQTGLKINPDDYAEKQKISIDQTQKNMDLTVAYRYISDENRTEANKNGKFPKAYLIDPVGKVTRLQEDNSKTYDSSNQNGNTYLSASIQDVIAGDWYLLYENFENTYKNAEINISSGNATSYYHNSSHGNISIYYDASATPHDFTITWEQTDRVLKNIRLTAPDGTEYSAATTPGNIMANEGGKYVIKVPNLVAGTYTFDIEGDKLGRVWVNCEESVGLNIAQETEVEPEVETEAQPAS